jgi:hypothetical protein
MPTSCAWARMATQKRPASCLAASHPPWPTRAMLRTCARRPTEAAFPASSCTPMTDRRSRRGPPMSRGGSQPARRQDHHTACRGPGERSSAGEAATIIEGSGVTPVMRTERGPPHRCIVEVAREGWRRTGHASTRDARRRRAIRAEPPDDTATCERPRRAPRSAVCGEFLGVGDGTRARGRRQLNPATLEHFHDLSAREHRPRVRKELRSQPSLPCLPIRDVATMIRAEPQSSERYSGHAGDTNAAARRLDCVNCRDFTMGRGGFEPPSNGL